MADKDRSKSLLSKDALPKIEVPVSAAHKIREFRMPAIVSESSARVTRKPATDDAAPAADGDKGEAGAGVAAAADASPGGAKGKADKSSTKGKADKSSTKAKADKSSTKAKADKSSTLEPGASADRAADAAVEVTARRAPTGKHRADSTMRFKDRTLNWFKEGDEIGEGDEDEEGEEGEGAESESAAEPNGGNTLRLVFAIVVVGLAAVLVWQLLS